MIAMSYEISRPSKVFSIQNIYNIDIKAGSILCTNVFSYSPSVPQQICITFWLVVKLSGKGLGSNS